MNSKEIATLFLSIKINDTKDIFYKDDDYTKLYVKNRATGKEIIDPQLQTMGRFAAIWVGAAGTKWMSDEEIRGATL
jgi:hypothetical protein